MSVSYNETVARIERLKAERQAVLDGVDPVAGITLRQQEQVSNLSARIAGLETDLPFLEDNGVDQYQAALRARQTERQRIKEVEAARAARRAEREETEREIDAVLDGGVMLVSVDRGELRIAFMQHTLEAAARKDGSRFSHHTDENGQQYTLTTESNGVVTATPGHES